MISQTIQKFHVIGISIRTTNENNQAAQDIPELWNKFMTESVIEKIPNKVENAVYCIYTEYEKDHTKPYTTILGCRVENLNNIPAEMTGLTIEEASYIKDTVKGNILQGLVFEAWTKIWNSNIDRKFSADFEVYDERAQDPENAEVDIFIAVK